MIVHCGDISGCEYYFEHRASCPIVMINGNNDFSRDLKNEEEFDIGKYHFWVTHGHRYGVKYGSETIFEQADRRGAKVVFYGHTHKPSVRYDDQRGIYAVNPGSLSYPRQENRRPSFVIMEIDRNEELHFNVNFL